MGEGRIPAAPVVGVTVVALTSAIISYGHVRSLALDQGQTALAALLYPLSLDGAIAAAVAAILAKSRQGRQASMMTWLLLGLGLSGSLAANIASAEPTITARVLAGFPPLMLAVGIEVLASLVRDVVPLVPEPVPVPLEVPEPTSTEVPVPEPMYGTEPSARARVADLVHHWSTAGEPINGSRVAEALGVSKSYGRRLLRQHQTA